MSRLPEMTFRIGNAALIGALRWLHRKFDISTTYRVDRYGAAAMFEGAWFPFSLREFGCTGNIDFIPEAENETRQALFGRMKDGQVFYDIGAHGGIYTVTAMRRFPRLVVHSFEPQPEALNLTLRLNDLPTDNLHAVALGNEPRTVRMTTKKRSSNHVSADGAREVPLVRLDDYASEKSLPSPDWIKIDVEGMELPALHGAENLLRNSHPTVIAEINHLHGRYGTTVTAFLDYMRSLGYEVHRLANGHLEPTPEASNFETLGYSADWNYWFLVRSNEA